MSLVQENVEQKQASSKPSRSDISTRHEQFKETRVKHKRMVELTEDLMTLCSAYGETNLIVITGATGVGKSTVTRVLLKALLAEMAELQTDSQSDIPLVAVEAYANAEVQYSFKDLYEATATQLLEPGLDRKCFFREEDGKLITRPQGRHTAAALRRIVEAALRQRKTKIWVIDEAYHLLRFGKPAVVVDALRSIAETANVKLILVGSFDLFDLVSEHGQVARRSAILNFDRYHHNQAADRQEFKRVLELLMTRWPGAQAPNFGAISDELMLASLGCIGLLKTMLLDGATYQMRNRGVWKTEFLGKMVKANGLRSVIAKGIEEGEAKVRDSLHGNSPWDQDALAELDWKMGDVHA